MKLVSTFLGILTSGWVALLSNGEFDVVILHTNDVHARIDETNSRSGECSASDGQAGKCFGGVSRRKTVIDAVRSEYDNVLLLDAGDQFQGTIWFNYYKGREAYTFMNMLGYDVMTLGNHEFDDGVEGLLPFLNQVTFPVLTCNLNLTREPRLVGLVKPYILTEVAGLLVAIIGVLTKTTTDLIEKTHAETLEIFDEVESVRKTVQDIRQLSPSIDFVIVLSHTGFPLEVRIAQEVDGIDLVVGGHSNSFLYTGTQPSDEEPVDTYPKIVKQNTGKQVLVIQDYTFGKYLGKLVLTFSDDNVLQSWSGNPILLDSSFQKDAAVEQVVSTMAEPLIALREKKLATSLILLDASQEQCRKRECILGNVLTDALVQINLRGHATTGWTKCAIAFFNSGGIKASIEQGDVSLGDILRVLPFGKEIVRMTVSGSTLIKALENSVAKYDKAGIEPPGGFLQMTGLRVVYNLDNAPSQRVVFVEAICTDCAVPRFIPVDMTASYSITTSCYLASGGDGYSMLKDERTDYEPLGYLAVDQFEKFLVGQELVYGRLEGRIRFITNESDITIPENCRTQNTNFPKTSPPTEHVTTCKPCDNGCTDSYSVLCTSLLAMLWGTVILLHYDRIRERFRNLLI